MSFSISGIVTYFLMRFLSYLTAFLDTTDSCLLT